MEETTKRSIRVANNQFPFEIFVRFFALIEILLVFVYTKYIATFSVYGSRFWLLAIVIAVFAGGSLVLSWKLERNWLSLLSGTILPVLVFEVVSMWKYSLVIRIVSIIVGVIGVCQEKCVSIFLTSYDSCHTTDLQSVYFQICNRVEADFWPLSHHRTCRSAYGGSIQIIIYTTDESSLCEDLFLL